MARAISQSVSIVFLCSWLGVQFASADVHNATWNGGNGTWNTASKWSGGVVPKNTASDQYDVFIDGGNNAVDSVVDGPISVVNSLTIDTNDTLSLSSGALISTVNGLTVNGGIAMAGGSITVGNGALNGSGGIGAAFNSLSIGSGSTSLSLGAGLTIQNDPTFGGAILIGGNYPLINNATIHAHTGVGSITVIGSTVTNNGSYLIDTGGLLQISAPISHLSDLGSITATGSGVVRFLGTFDNSQNTLIADGSINGLQMGGLIQGGTITATSSNRLIVADATLDGVTLNAPTTVLSSLRVAAGQELHGTSDVLLNGGFVAAASGTFTVDAGVNIHGLGTVGQSDQPFVNNSHITADTNKSLAITGNGITNNGSFEIGSGAVLSIGGTFQPTGLGNIVNDGGALNLTGTMNNASHTLVVDATHPWQISSGTISGGIVQTTANHNLLVPGSNSATLDGVELDGNLQMGVFGATLNIPHGITGNGTILMNGQSNQIQTTFSGDALEIGAGITITGSAGRIGTTAQSTINHGIIQATNNAAIRIDSRDPLDGGAPILSDGELIMTTGGKITTGHLSLGNGGEILIDN
jgi:hypothetical protein